MSYSNGLLSDQSYQTANKYVQRGLPGVGFKLTDTGDYDMQNKKLVNVDEGENNQDVVNKHQLDVGLQTKPNKTDVLLLDGTTHMVGDLNLRGNKIILPGEIQMDRKLITNLDTDENQDLSAVNMITLKKKVELKMNKIISEDVNLSNKQIKNLGYDIKDPGDVVNLGFTDQKYLQKVSDSDLDMNDHRIKNSLEPINNKDLTTKNYVDNQMGTKADLSKTTTQTFQGRVQVPDFNSGGHNGSDIVNLRYIDGIFLNKKTGGTLNNPITFLSSLPSNQKQIHNIGSPQFNSSAANKQYIDGEIGKIASVDTTQFIKRMVQYQWQLIWIWVHTKS